ncbi:MAG: NAD+ synthase [Candidatus Bipolaricaulota bacterium]|nr:NAD+ synthase [Candidatus Bipolaricaulota bacterium]
MRIAVGQLNPTVGDLPGNRDRILGAIGEARREGADLVVFPELALLGYPPRDLLHRSGFLAAAEQEFGAIVGASEGIGVILGHVLRGGARDANRADPSAAAFGGGTALYNAAFLLADRGIVGHQAKHRLPSFDVFEEERYFAPGEEIGVLEWGGLRLGLSVCEDFWYEGGVLAAQAAAGVDLLVNVSASPYFRGKPLLRYDLARRWAEASGAPLVYANLAGAQDELAFDGGSFALRPDGAFLLAAPRFREGVFVFDTAGPPVPPPAPDGLPEVKEALVTGIRDYFGKNGLRGAVIGISGGVDSAVVAALAAHALGTQKVLGAFLPGPYTAEESGEEARQIAEALGIRLVEIRIDPIFSAFADGLSPHVPVEGVTAENLQARIRGVLLMALANSLGYAVLACGNKAELGTGYTTLYGDTVGALAPIGDLLKGEVYALARLLNDEAGRAVIPEGTLRRPPSAELRPGQRDDQDLPPYELLDPLLQGLVVDNRPWDELGQRFGEEVVSDVARRLYRSEYKRRQYPIVLKVSPKAFGIGRRFPVTGGFGR